VLILFSQEEDPDSSAAIAISWLSVLCNLDLQGVMYAEHVFFRAMQTDVGWRLYSSVSFLEIGNWFSFFHFNPCMKFTSATITTGNRPAAT